MLRIAPASQQVVARSRFLIRQSRLDYERMDFLGSRTDTLRREAAGWRLARREIILTSTVLLAKNLSIFFWRNAPRRTNQRAVETGRKET